jgi:heat-inducible transcriptional repressor
VENQIVPGELTERQRLILALVIREHTESAHPVGSKDLVEKYHLQYSPATVRNELSELTERGFLRQPHTSAGREPTEEGYRFFVRQLMGHTELPINVKRTISHQFYQAGHDVDRMMRLAASVLASQSKSASLVTAPHPERPIFKHVELISTRGRQVLMVAVYAGGEVRQQMLVLAEPVSQEQLSQVANEINTRCEGIESNILSAIAGQMDALGQDILKLIQDEMKRSSHTVSGEVYRDGLTNMLAKPEFAEAGVARNALKILEDRLLLEDLISRSMTNSGVGGVQVLIAGENTWEELRDCTVVLARYGDPSHATGMLGVLGPIRMAYGHTISTVRFVAGLLSELVIDMMAE